MKALILAATLFAVLPAIAHAEAPAPDKAAVIEDNDLRIVRVTKPPLMSERTCDNATWPYIPADCLSRQGADTAVLDPK